jgi:hypothetical protein
MDEFILGIYWEGAYVHEKKGETRKKPHNQTSKALKRNMNVVVILCSVVMHTMRSF